MNDDLDIDSMLEEFENEWTDEEVEHESESETDETEEEDETGTSEEETPTDETEKPDPNDDDAEKRNRAFADLRRENEANRKYADFINKLAEDNGIKPDDLLAQYEQRRISDEAEQKGIPVEYLQKQTATESRLEQLEQQLRAERLQTQIDEVSSKYGANEDSIRDTFQEMLQAGIDPRVQDNVNFEKFYRAANLDSIIQKEVENARQKDLDSKKKRQESAAIPNGTSASQSNNSEWSDEDFEAELKRMDIRL